MKKLLCTLFAAILFSFSATVLASAQEEKCITFEEPPLFYASQTSLDSTDKYFDSEELRKVLSDGFVKQQESIDVSSLGISFDNDAVNAVFDFVRNEMVEFFHVETESAWGYDTMTSLEVTYTMSHDEYLKDYRIWQQNVELLLDEIKDNNELTDVEKALLIHDRIIIHCEYDYENYLSDTLPPEVYTEYGVLVNGLAVCQGYAETYMYLLKQVGIKSELCRSASMRHVWNIVYIDGDRFYVDVTFDDPVWDISGNVSHDNFLCSIWEFYKSHDASDYDRSITNTKYDNYFWTKSDAAFQLVNGEIYYIDSQEGFIKTIDGIPVINIKAYWKAKSGGNWIGSFSRLYSEGTKLIYSLPSSIWYYDLTSGENEKIFTPANSFGTYFFIYGYKYLDGKLICELNDYPLFDKNTKKLYSVSGTVTLKDPFQITLGSDKAIVNTEVCIPISICGNPGISDIELAVYYNSQALTLVKCERSNAFPFDASTDTSTPGKITLYLNSDHDWWKNGTCIWLTFKINETASISDYNIIAEKTVLKNQSGKDLSAKLISGMATVLGIGDVSGDHRINTRDVVLVAQLVAEWENISLYSSAADCNGDGIINTRDIVLLAQYIAGWGVHLGK